MARYVVTGIEATGQPRYVFGPGERIGVRLRRVQDDVDRAWALYCQETAGSLDARDFWHELPATVQAYYLNKAN